MATALANVSRLQEMVLAQYTVNGVRYLGVGAKTAVTFREIGAETSPKTEGARGVLLPRSVNPSQAQSAMLPF
jgi:hypothetical protein